MHDFDDLRLRIEDTADEINTALRYVCDDMRAIYEECIHATYDNIREIVDAIQNIAEKYV